MQQALPCPECGGTDRFYLITKPKHGGDLYWQCRQCSHKEYDRNGQPSGVAYKGSELTLAQAEAPKRQGASNAKPTSYKNLAAYAAAHGVDVMVFVRAGWTDCTQWQRPALRITTESESRYRFIDGATPKYWHPTDSHKGDKRVWYKLPEALDLSEQSGCLVLCNGEGSTVVAQHYGIPALAPAGGGEKVLPDHLLDQLQAAWTGPIIVAMDSDTAGRKAAPKLVTQLRTVGYVAHAVDLGDGNDLADWCKLYQRESLARLHTAPVQAAPVQAAPVQIAAPFSQDAPRNTDLGNAQRFRALYGDTTRYVYSWGQWLLWDGTQWAKDETGGAMRLARQVVKEMYREAADCTDDKERLALAKHAMACESAGRLGAMLELAKSEEGLAAIHTQFDNELWLLNCLNGTIDLRTGTLRPHDSADFLTKRVDIRYEPNAVAPRWDAFLRRITDGDTELQTYLQRAIGYSLTGKTGEQCLFFLHGEGANGKSTFFNAVTPLFGPYFAKLHASSLLKRNNDSGVPNDIAQLVGVRMVVSSELAGNQFDEEKVKDLTGSEAISSRFMRAEWFKFTPQFKLWLYGNKKPRIIGTDDGIWRRIRLIPFTARLAKAEQDTQLGDKLLTELPGILRWAVQGCLDWQRYGLTTPKRVLDATSQYRDDMDTLGAFFDECCVVNRRATVTSAALYMAYTQWCEASGERRLTKKALGVELDKREFRKTEVEKGTLRIGIGLLSQNNAGVSGVSGVRIGINGQPPTHEAVIRNLTPDTPDTPAIPDISGIPQPQTDATAVAPSEVSEVSEARFGMNDQPPTHEAVIPNLTSDTSDTSDASGISGIPQPQTDATAVAPAVRARALEVLAAAKIALAQAALPSAPTAPATAPAAPVAPLASDEEIDALAASLPEVWAEVQAMALESGVDPRSVPSPVWNGTAKGARRVMARRILEARRLVA